MDKARRALQTIEWIAAQGYSSALVGGLAVSVRTRERFTKDIDFAVAVASDAEAESLAHALQQLGFRLLQVIEQEAKGVIATLRFQHPQDEGADPTLDLLFGSSGIEAEVVSEATQTVIAAGITLPVACIPHLISMKVLAESAVRDHDLADLRVLLTAASVAEVARARELVRLIEERGFHRGRDLQKRLNQLIKDLLGSDG